MSDKIINTILSLKKILCTQQPHSCAVGCQDLKFYQVIIRQTGEKAARAKIPVLET